MQCGQAKALFGIEDKEEACKYLILKIVFNTEQVPAWLSVGKGLEISFTAAVSLFIQDWSIQACLQKICTWSHRKENDPFI